MTRWNYFWKQLNTKINGRSLENWRWLQYCWVCSWDTPNTVLSCVSGTVGLDPNTTIEKAVSKRNSATREKNVQPELSLSEANFFCPHLHSKLGLMKNFVKGMNKDERLSSTWEKNFHGWVRLKLRKESSLVLKFVNFLWMKTSDESSRIMSTAWGVLKSVVHGFLGNRKAGNY